MLSCLSRCCCPSLTTVDKIYSPYADPSQENVQPFSPPSSQNYTVEAETKKKIDALPKTVVIAKENISCLEHVLFLKAELEYPNRSGVFRDLIKRINGPLFLRDDMIAMIADRTFSNLAMTETGFTLTGYQPTDLIGYCINKLTWQELAGKEESPVKRAYMFEEAIKKQGYLEQTDGIHPKRQSLKAFSAHTIVFVHEPYYLILHKKINDVFRFSTEEIAKFQAALKTVTRAPLFVVIARANIDCYRSVFYFKPEFAFPARHMHFHRVVYAISAPAFNKQDEMTLICNQELVLLAATKNVTSMTGYEPHEIMLQKIMMFMTPEVAMSHREPTGKTFRFTELMDKDNYFIPIRTQFIIKGKDYTLEKEAVDAEIFLFRGGMMYFIILVRFCQKNEMKITSKSFQEKTDAKRASEYLPLLLKLPGSIKKIM